MRSVQQDSGFMRASTTKTRSRFVRELISGIATGSLLARPGEAAFVSESEWSAFGYNGQTLKNGPAGLLSTKAMAKRGYKFLVTKGKLNDEMGWKIERVN